MEEGSDDAVQAALRLLRHRDRSASQIERELEERGIGEAARTEAVATLERTGVVDDKRFAERRARALAERGAGDALIRHDLSAAGVAGDVVDRAVATLADEHERARGIVERRGTSAKTVRYLLGKGFSGDVVHAVVARAGGQALG